MVVIKISYPYQSRFGSPSYNHHHPATSSSSANSASVSPTLTDSSSEPLPSLLQVSSDGDTLATSKQEEWVTKRKTELVTTKQIETRVKRQLVLEDGKVVEDSGPIVTTSTTEDTDKNESEHTEHKSHGDDQPVGEGWIPIESIPEDAVVRETNEKKVTTHDEVEDILETEEIQHYGDMTNLSLSRAIREEGESRRSGILTKDRNELLSPLSPVDKEFPQKRIVNQSRRHDRTTDIEDTKEVSKLNDIGNLVTEITRRHEHEEFHNEDIPDSDSDEFEHIETRGGSRDYNHSKNEDYIEYLAVPKGGNLSSGRKVGEGVRIVSENISTQRDGDEDLWDSVSERIKKYPKDESQPNLLNSKLNTPLTATSRSDALTSRPLDFGQEEHTRKHETNRWLNSHFGSSSSSLNSEASPKSPLQRSTPQGIHVTMTSRSSPLLTSPPPPPPMPKPATNGSNLGQRQRQLIYSSKGIVPPPANPKPGRIFQPESIGKKISFEDRASPRPSPIQKDVQFDLKNRHEDVMRSLNSQFGRSSLTKSGSHQWDEEPTPTPPPRTRRRNSPDFRNVRTPDHTANVHQVNTMNYHQSRKNTASPPQEVPSYLQKSGDTGERKAYERREQSFGYSGPGQRNLSRDTLDSGDSGYVTKHSNYYKTEENNNPTQSSLYKNGDAEVTERKTVERREKVFTYDGASQKQFHPKYIVGTPSSTMGRLRGIEGSGAILEEDDRPSQTLPRRRFYFGDEEGSLLSKHAALEPRRSTGGRSERELRFGVDDINVSISNKYNSANNGISNSKSSGLSRSMSFTPRSLTRDKAPVFVHSPTLAQIPKSNYVYKSNPHLVDSPDLLSPRLISLMSRSVRDVNSLSSNNYANNKIENDSQNVYSNRRDTTNVSRSKRTFLENVKKNSSDLYESGLNRTKASSPSRSMTPTSYSPTSRNERNVVSRSLNSPRPFGGANSPLSDDYQETYRMTNSTPDSDITKPRISTDTTSKFSRKTLRGPDGSPTGKVQSSETTTRTKSRFKESEVMYPKGREGSPGSFRPQLTSGGSVIIPVRENNKGVHYAH